MKGFGRLAFVLTIFLIAAVRAGEPDPSLLPASPTTAQNKLAGAEIETLFSVDTDPGTRAKVLKRAVELAMAGDGLAAFDLGVLYRHGPDHPSRAVERNVDTARYWLEKCVESENCPDMALASLAELELAAGNDKAATQWAQAWTALQKVLDDDRRKSGNKAGSDAYAAYLLSRCYERIESSKRKELIAQWYKEMIDKRGEQLGRMRAWQRQDVAQERERWADFFMSKSPKAITLRPPDAPSLGFFLLRAAPAGGRAEAVILIEALPGPGKMGDFRNIVGRFQSKPYSPTEEDPKRYGFMPIAFDDPRYGLVARPD